MSISSSPSGDVVAARAGDLHLEALAEVPVVVDAGQPVGDRQLQGAGVEIGVFDRQPGLVGERQQEFALVAVDGGRGALDDQQADRAALGLDRDQDGGRGVDARVELRRRVVEQLLGAEDDDLVLRQRPPENRVARRVEDERLRARHPLLEHAALAGEKDHPAGVPQVVDDALQHDAEHPVEVQGPGHRARHVLQDRQLHQPAVEEAVDVGEDAVRARRVARRVGARARRGRASAREARIVRTSRTSSGGSKGLVR